MLIVKAMKTSAKIPTVLALFLTLSLIINNQVFAQLADKAPGLAHHYISHPDGKHISKQIRWSIYPNIDRPGTFTIHYTAPNAQRPRLIIKGTGVSVMIVHRLNSGEGTQQIVEDLSMLPRGDYQIEIIDDSNQSAQSLTVQNY